MVLVFKVLGSLILMGAFLWGQTISAEASGAVALGGLGMWVMSLGKLQEVLKRTAGNPSQSAKGP